jgi:hypothetical protein
MYACIGSRVDNLSRLHVAVGLGPTLFGFSRPGLDSISVAIVFDEIPRLQLRIEQLQMLHCNSQTFGLLVNRVETTTFT